MQSHQPQDDVRHRELRQAHQYSEDCNWEAAYDLAYKWLKIDPNDSQALNIIAYIMLNTEKVAIAYPILKHLTTIEPEDPLAWLNMGMASNDLWRYQESLRAYKKGLACAKSDKDKSMLCVNIASLMVDHGRFKEAEPYCRQAIALRGDTIKGKANLGFCQLANKDWAEGWRNYRHCMGSEWRRVVQYNDEPLWDGEAKGTICVYGEQGLGDEISFGQMLPDMKAWCDKNDSRLIVDVNPRLETLFKRSFPDIEIHGTRGQSQITWDPRDITHSIPIAQIGEYFRCKDEQFTGEPYLKADPDRVLQWKSLFATKRKPVIGIGYRSGIWKTAAKYRQIDLEAMLPLLKSVDAHWVSLQYKPAGQELVDFKEAHPEVDIIEYSHGTLTNDYDDTVAMIQAMDMVIAVQTTAIHVAGGLGIPTWVLVPKTSQWRYGEEGEDFPWANSVKILRQTEDGFWDNVIESAAKRLKEMPRSFLDAYKPGLPESTASNARKPEDQLRDSGSSLRRNRRRNDRLNGDQPSA